MLYSIIFHRTGEVSVHLQNKVGIAGALDFNRLQQQAQNAILKVLSLTRSIFMKQRELAQELTGNEYPGRGIVIGVSEDGLNAVTAYFIMGTYHDS